MKYHKLSDFVLNQDFTESDTLKTSFLHTPEVCEGWIFIIGIVKLNFTRVSMKIQPTKASYCHSRRLR